MAAQRVQAVCVEGVAEFENAGVVDHKGHVGDRPGEGLGFRGFCHIEAYGNDALEGNEKGVAGGSVDLSCSPGQGLTGKRQTNSPVCPCHHNDRILNLHRTLLFHLPKGDDLGVWK